MKTKIKRSTIIAAVREVQAEQATGIQATLCRHNNGLGTLYLGEHETVTPQQAYDALQLGGEVEVPNAGSGSYERFFELVGFAECKVWEWTSSAGDWSFGVRDGAMWYRAFQSNRYPHHGFRYSVDFDQPFDAFENIG